jgi:hypothetical protein
LQGVGKLKRYVSLRTAEGGEAIAWLIWKLLWRLRRPAVTQLTMLATKHIDGFKGERSASFHT